jgi:hypothetical protein
MSVMADEIRTDLHDLRTRDFFHGADRLDRIRRLPREVERDEPGLTDATRSPYPPRPSRIRPAQRGEVLAMTDLSRASLTYPAALPPLPPGEGWGEGVKIGHGIVVGVL